MALRFELAHCSAILPERGFANAVIKAMVRG